MTHYRFESDLVEHFCSTLSEESPWPSALVLREFDYRSGRTDVVLAVGDKIVAIEAKLEKWKTALHQAYRNTCFADLSYVLLPHKAAMTALSNQPEFDRRGVWLFTVLKSSGQIDLVICVF